MAQRFYLPTKFGKDQLGRLEHISKTKLHIHSLFHLYVGLGLPLILEYSTLGLALRLNLEILTRIIMATVSISATIPVFLARLCNTVSNPPHGR